MFGLLTSLSPLKIGLILAGVAYVGYLNFSISSLKGDVASEKAKRISVEQQLALQSQIIESNRVEYEKKMAALPQAMTKIETKYKIVYRNIEKIRGDKNATCANSLNNLNTFQY